MLHVKQLLPPRETKIDTNRSGLYLKTVKANEIICLFGLAVNKLSVPVLYDAETMMVYREKKTSLN